MASAGILLHCRHLETIKWEDLVWGKPREDSFGSLPMLVWLLLHEPADEPFTTLLISKGPSSRDGMSEGSYTKQYLLRRLPDLRAFPRLTPLLDDAKLAELRKRISDMIITDASINTNDEIRPAAEIFAARGVTKVFQLTAVNHAPRCIRSQTVSREAGYIPKEQIWAVVADERPFAGANAGSTFIEEPRHRGDDPLVAMRPALHEALAPYPYQLPLDKKKELIGIIDSFMRQHTR